MPVDTAKVENRRKLKFENIEDILADVEHLNQGKFKTLGNWSGGQILKHLTIVMNGSIDGMPASFPWILRKLLGPPMKKRVLAKGMTPGFQLPARAAKNLVPSETSWEEGVKGIRAAIRRLQTESKREPHIFFGAMTRDEWNRLHCHHASMHLSFLVPEPN